VGAATETPQKIKTLHDFKSPFIEQDMINTFIDNTKSSEKSL
jgi:hypothetical protein